MKVYIGPYLKCKVFKTEPTSAYKICVDGHKIDQSDTYCRECGMLLPVQQIGVVSNHFNNETNNQLSDWMCASLPSFSPDYDILVPHDDMVQLLSFDVDFCDQHKPINVISSACMWDESAIQQVIDVMKYSSVESLYGLVYLEL